MHEERGAPLEAGGGVECTVNRIGDGDYDQAQRSGHHDMAAGFGPVRFLGIRAIVLTSDRAVLLSSLEAAIRRYVQEGDWLSEFTDPRTAAS